MRREEAARYHSADVASIFQDWVDSTSTYRDLAIRLAKPNFGDEAPLNKAIRYNTSRPRCQSLHQWQEVPNQLDVHTDSDWGDDTASRISTSGGMVMLGRSAREFFSTYSSLELISACLLLTPNFIHQLDMPDYLQLSLCCTMSSPLFRSLFWFSCFCFC